MDQAISFDFKNPLSYKNKKMLKVIKALSDEEINKYITAEVIVTIGSLDEKIINTIFRNVSAQFQIKMWADERIQSAIILGSKDVSKIVCGDNLIRELENLNKVIKSQSIKRNLYSNKYFVYAIIKQKKIEQRFFHSYDINKIFEGVIASEIYNGLSIEEQQYVLELLNKYTRELLLPNDFRKISNIKKILFETDIDSIPDIVLSQLNEDELLFLEYINNNSSNKTLTRIIEEYLKNKKASFLTLIQEINKRETSYKQLLDSFRTKNVYYLYRLTSLEERVYNIVLTSEDDEIKESVIEYISNFISQNTSIDYNFISSTIRRNMNLKLLDYQIISKLLYIQNNNDYELKMQFYLKFGIALYRVDYLNGITAEQISKVNVKHINKIKQLVDNEEQDEIAVQYANSIKLYFIYGYERSLDILKERYGTIDKTFFDNVAKTDISRVTMKEEGSKYIPIVDMRFINFMFERQDNNHFIEMLKNKESSVYRMWYHFYNNYDHILNKCHNQITLKKLVSILETEKYDIDRGLITPDNYLLNKNIFLENIILGNKTRHSNTKVLEEIITIYNQMRKRLESSIPYVENKDNEYSYQSMYLDDPIIFTLGYRADCCIRTLDIAHFHLKHAALCRNGRVMLIYHNNELAAFAPLKRNGNVLIVNSIECIKKDKKYREGIINALNEAILEMVNVCALSEEPIDLVCIGSGAYAKPTGETFPATIPTPTIYESDIDEYKNTDCYHKKLDIIYVKEDFNFSNIYSKDPKTSYMDPRPNVKEIISTSDKMEVKDALNIINAINYEKYPNNYQELINVYLYKAYYSKDWYVYLNYQGVIGECLDTDPRAREEYEYYLNKLLEYNEQKKLKKSINDSN